MIISLLVSLIGLVISHAVYKTVRYHVEKKLSLKVVRLYDMRYFTREVLRQVRGYFHRQTNLRNYILSVTVLGLITFSVFVDMHYSLYSVELFSTKPFFLIAFLCLFFVLLLEPGNRVWNVLYLNPLLLVLLALLSFGLTQPAFDKVKGAAEVALGLSYLLLSVYVGALSSEFMQKETIKNYYHKLLYNFFQIAIFVHLYSYLLRTVDDTAIKVVLIWLLSTLSCLVLTAVLYASPIIKVEALAKKSAKILFWILLVFQISVLMGIRS